MGPHQLNVKNHPTGHHPRHLLPRRPSPHDPKEFNEKYLLKEEKEARTHTIDGTKILKKPTKHKTPITLDTPLWRISFTHVICPAARPNTNPSHIARPHNPQGPIDDDSEEEVVAADDDPSANQFQALRDHAKASKTADGGDMEVDDDAAEVKAQQPAAEENTEEAARKAKAATEEEIARTAEAEKAKAEEMATLKARAEKEAALKTKELQDALALKAKEDQEALEAKRMEELLLLQEMQNAQGVSSSKDCKTAESILKCESCLMNIPKDDAEAKDFIDGFASLISEELGLLSMTPGTNKSGQGRTGKIVACFGGDDPAALTRHLGSHGNLYNGKQFLLPICYNDKPGSMPTGHLFTLVIAQLGWRNMGEPKGPWTYREYAREKINTTYHKAAKDPDPTDLLYALEVGDRPQKGKGSRKLMVHFFQEAAAFAVGAVLHQVSQRDTVYMLSTGKQSWWTCDECDETHQDCRFDKVLTWSRFILVVNFTDANKPYPKIGPLTLGNFQASLPPGFEAHSNAVATDTSLSNVVVIRRTEEKRIDAATLNAITASKTNYCRCWPWRLVHRENTRSDCV